MPGSEAPKYGLQGAKDVICLKESSLPQALLIDAQEA